MASTPPTQESLADQINDGIAARLNIKTRKRLKGDDIEDKYKEAGKTKLAELYPGLIWTSIPNINKMCADCAEWAIANSAAPKPRRGRPPKENVIVVNAAVPDPDIEEAVVNENVTIKG